jgi:hypothetical protein
MNGGKKSVTITFEIITCTLNSGIQLKPSVLTAVEQAELNSKSQNLEEEILGWKLIFNTFGRFIISHSSHGGRLILPSRNFPIGWESLTTNDLLHECGNGTGNAIVKRE